VRAPLRQATKPQHSKHDAPRTLARRQEPEYPLNRPPTTAAVAAPLTATQHATHSEQTNYEYRPNKKMGLLSLFPRLLRGCAVCFAAVQTYKAAREAGAGSLQSPPTPPTRVLVESSRRQRNQSSRRLSGNCQTAPHSARLDKWCSLQPTSIGARPYCAAGVGRDIAKKLMGRLSAARRRIAKRRRREAKLKVGPDRCCSPRHPTRFEPSFLELHDIL